MYVAPIIFEIGPQRNYLFPGSPKVIIHKSLGEAPVLVEQDTIEFFTVTCLKFIIIFLKEKITFLSPPFYAASQCKHYNIKI